MLRLKRLMLVTADKKLDHPHPYLRKDTMDTAFGTKILNRKNNSIGLLIKTWLNEYADAKIWMATTKAKHCYSDVSYGKDDYIMFGKESAGIPEEILVDYEETCIRIPMLDKIRSLNLSNSVAIVLYEALRQTGFEAMSLEGELHRLSWKSEE